MLPHTSTSQARLVSATVLVATLLGFSDSYAQMQEFRLAAGIVYYECVNPEQELRCFCTNEEQKNVMCPGCQMWAERTLDARWNVQFDTGGYSVSVPPYFPRANYFGRDVAEQVYQVSFPQTAAGNPVTSNTLYTSHEQFRWFEVDETGSRVGALAVTRSWIGFVVADDGDVQVLYPSSVLEGDLTVGDIQYVMPGEPVKYLVPEELFVSDPLP